MKTQTALLNLMTLVTAFSLLAQNARATAQEDHPERFAFGEKVLKTTDFVGPMGNARERLQKLIAKSFGRRIQEAGNRPLDQFSTVTLRNGEASLHFTHQGEFLSEAGGAGTFDGELTEDFVFSTSIILGDTLERGIGFIMLAALRLPPREDLLKSAESVHVDLARLNYNVVIPKGTRFHVVTQETSDGSFLLNNVTFDFSLSRPISMVRIGADQWKLPQYMIQ